MMKFSCGGIHEKIRFISVKYILGDGFDGGIRQAFHKPIDARF